jgi:hypothetical protein
VKKPAKVLLGLATLWALVYPVFFAVGIAKFWATLYSRILTLANPETTDLPAVPFEYLLLIPPLLLTLVLVVALVAYYVRHAIASPRIPQEMKAVWIILLVLANVVVMPIYWYLYIWREPKLRRPEVTAYGAIERPPPERPRRYR